MKTKQFCAVIETAIQRAFGETLAFETIPYVHGEEDPNECLGIVIIKNWHFAKIVAHAAHVIAEDPDNIFERDMPHYFLDDLEEFANLVSGMRVAPYMQWTAIYFPGLTEEQVLGEAEAGHPTMLETDTAVGRDPVTGTMPPKVIAWQTGRAYGPNGQRIGAVLRDDGAIVFHDIDRGIYGRLYEDTRFDQASIMVAYDTNSYTNELTSDDDHVIIAKQAAEEL